MNRLFESFAVLPKFRLIGEDKFIASCPMHTDKTPSFRGVLSGTKLKIYCHSCHAKAGEILAAMGLTWGALFTDSATPPFVGSRIQADRQRAREASEAATLRLQDEYYAIAHDLDERDALLELSWMDYEGPETWELLGRLYDGKSYLEWRLDVLAEELKI